MTASPDLSLLAEGEIQVEGRMPWSSNGTFLVSVCRDSVRTRAVYKPGRGERPLWDFPGGLWRREVAAYELSAALRWPIVPTTVVRHDGPLGEGSLQAFVEADFEQHYFTLLEDPRRHDQLRRICLFDLIVNNTDRKSGHCLVDRSGHIWAIDNGLSFHRECKLRTVIWDFAGEPVPEALVADVEALLAAGVPGAVAGLIDPEEGEALLGRAQAVVESGTFPVDPTGRRYPWPLV